MDLIKLLIDQAIIDILLMYSNLKRSLKIDKIFCKTNVLTLKYL